jgi:hypothetical protein
MLIVCKNQYFIEYVVAISWELGVARSRELIAGS